jgi:Transmembrane domain of unknown function (DUF3566)
MRTFNAVRMRLRAATQAAGSDGNDIATRGDTSGNGSRPQHTVGTMAPMDPLLADQATSGEGNGDEAAVRSHHAAVTSFDSDARGSDAPSDTVVESPFEAVPLVVPPTEAFAEAPGPPDDEASPAGAPARRAAGPRRQRSRPALPLLRRRPRVRKVTRIVRRVDAWGVFKISVIFYVILYIILLVAGVLLWNLANTTGTVANVEGFIRDLFGLKTFEFDGEKLFRASWVLGAILVVAGTGFNVTMAILFNLISDLVGGVRVTVLEEEVVLRERPLLPPSVAADQAARPEAEPPADTLVPPAAFTPADGINAADDTEIAPPPEMSPAPGDPLVAERPPRRPGPATRRTPAKVSARRSNGGVRSAPARPPEPVSPPDPEGG